MREEVHVLPGFEGTQGIDASIYRRVYEYFAARSGQCGFLNRCYYFSHVETADLLHLERRTIQIPIFPSEFVRIWVVLEIFLRIYIGKAVLCGTRETKMFSNLSAPIMVWQSSMAVVVTYRPRTSSAISQKVCSLALYLYMWKESLTSVAKMRSPHVFIVLMGEERFFTQALRSSLLRPTSQQRKHLPIPAKMRSFHAYNTKGTSSTSVSWNSLAQLVLPSHSYTLMQGLLIVKEGQYFRLFTQPNSRKFVVMSPSLVEQQHRDTHASSSSISIFVTIFPSFPEKIDTCECHLPSPCADSKTATFFSKTSIFLAEQVRGILSEWKILPKFSKLMILRWFSLKTMMVCAKLAIWIHAATEMKGKARRVAICFCPNVQNSQGLDDNANTAGRPNTYNFTSFTGFAPRYFGLESVSLPVIGSIDVLTTIPFCSPAQRYSCMPYRSASASLVAISSMAIASIALRIFCVDNMRRQLSGLSQKIRVVKSLRAAARKLDRTRPFSTGEKSNATTQLSREACVTSERAPVWSSSQYMMSPPARASTICRPRVVPFMILPQNFIVRAVLSFLMCLNPEGKTCTSESSSNLPTCSVGDSSSRPVSLVCEYPLGVVVRMRVRLARDRTIMRSCSSLQLLFTHHISCG